jgi:oligopeptide transport system substrate-binding protein
MMRHAILLLFSLLLAACGRDTNADLSAPLRYGTAELPTVVDPQRAETSVEQLLATQVFLGLVTVDASGKIIPGIAKSWVVSPDGLSYIFRLRGSVWSDDVPVTADTFVESFRRLFQSGRKSASVNDFRAILNADSVLQKRKSSASLGVKALAPDVLEIRLIQPQPSFLDLLATPAAAPVPLHVLVKSKEGVWPAAAKLVFNGPYLIESLGSVQIRLVPNKKYALAGFENRLAVQYELQRDPAKALSQFLGGDLDVLDTTTLPLDVLQQDSRLRRQTRQEPEWAIVGLVLQQSDPVLKDVRFRRALAMLVDRQNLVDANFPKLEFQPALSLTPPLLTSYPLPAQPEWAAWTDMQRIEEAQRLLAELEISLEKPVVVRVVATNAPRNEKLIAYVARVWAPYGVTLKPELMATKNVVRAVTTDQYQMAVWAWKSSTDQPDGFFRNYMCGKKSGNILNFCNPEVDALMVAALNQTDPVQRAENFRQAERLILQDMPTIPLYVPMRRMLVSDRLLGWQENTTGRHPFERLSRKKRGL